MGVLDTLKSQWDSAVADFQAKERAFMDAASDLVNNRDRYYAAGLGDQYESLASKGRMIQSTVTNVADTIAGIYQWLKDSFGLGFLPALPFAALAAAVAAIAAFLTGYTALKGALVEYEIRQLPPEMQAQARLDVIKQQSAPSAIENVASSAKSSLWALAVLAIGVIALPKILEMVRKR